MSPICSWARYISELINFFMHKLYCKHENNLDKTKITQGKQPCILWSRLPITQGCSRGKWAAASILQSYWAQECWKTSIFSLNLRGIVCQFILGEAPQVEVCWEKIRKFERVLLWFGQFNRTEYLLLICNFRWGTIFFMHFLHTRLIGQRLGFFQKYNEAVMGKFYFFDSSVV